MLRYFFLSVNCEIIIQRNDTMIELYAMYNTVWNRERRFLSVWMEISLLIISRLVSNKAHTHTHTWHKASVGWICVMGWGPYEASFQLISFTTSRKRDAIQFLWSMIFFSHCCCCCFLHIIQINALFAIRLVLGEKEWTCPWVDHWIRQRNWMTINTHSQHSHTSHLNRALTSHWTLSYKEQCRTRAYRRFSSVCVEKNDQVRKQVL